MNRMRHTLALASFLALAPLALLASPEVRIESDRLFLKADGDRLEEVLQGFVHAGVSVRIDPGIDAIVTGTLEDVDVETGLDNLLESFNYILFWDVLRGPIGPMPRLSRIDIFRPGHRRAVTEFEAGDANLETIRDPENPSLLIVKDEILVGFKAGISAAQFRALLDSIGGMAIGSLPELGVYRIRLPANSNIADILRKIGGHPMVAVAEPNRVVSLPPTAASKGSEPSARSLDVPDDGSASLAIFDSGLTVLPELAKAVAGKYDAVDPHRDLTDPVGHGTQMALIGSGSVLPYGAPGNFAADSLPILAVRAFDDNGLASSYVLMNAMEYAVGQDAEVINMSWGTEAKSEFLANAIRYVQDQGVVVVAAAGNEPTQRPIYPAAYPNVIAVAALDGSGQRWPNSNYGDFITLAAPGMGSFPIGHNGPPGSYAGTSISSAYVAGALTRYFSAHPSASAAQATRALVDSLTDAGPPGKDPEYGYGVLDSAAMMRLLGGGG